MQTLIIPGLNGSGPGHWQTLWAEKYGFGRVEQHDWENPDPSLWTGTLDAYIEASKNPVVLVAHSLGCLTVAHWARVYREKINRVHAAFLVTPPDVECSPHIPEALRCFAAHELLPFPSLVVGSENDPYMTRDDAQALAADWGSRFVNAGAVGHINLDSGHGPWPEGEILLQDFLKLTTK